jgi:hypothetical protein
MSANEPLTLYHGTAASRVDSIRAAGLFPRTPPRYPEYWAMLTDNRQVAEGFARREPLDDRAVITYLVPGCQVGTYLHPPRTVDPADYALKEPLPGSMITDVDVDIPGPASIPSGSAVRYRRASRNRHRGDGERVGL